MGMFCSTMLGYPSQIVPVFSVYNNGMLHTETRGIPETLSPALLGGQTRRNGRSNLSDLEDSQNK